MLALFLQELCLHFHGPSFEPDRELLHLGADRVPVDPNQLEECVVGLKRSDTEPVQNKGTKHKHTPPVNRASAEVKDNNHDLGAVHVNKASMSHICGWAVPDMSGKAFGSELAVAVRAKGHVGWPSTILTHAVISLLLITIT